MFDIQKTTRVICFAFLCASWHVEAQSVDQIARLEQSRKQEKNTILVFSGSDWCKPCIRLEKEVLANPRFLRNLSNHFTLLKVDFPRRKRLDPSDIRRNELLAEKYNPEGAFPKVVLISPDQSSSIDIDYTHYDVDRFVKQILDLSRSYSHHTFDRESLLMGTRFNFTLVDSANSNRIEELLNACIEEVRRIERAISEWDPASAVSQVNSGAGSPVRVDPEVYALIERSKILARLTQGAFDISFLPLLDVWDFDRSTISELPQDRVDQVVPLVGYKKILLLDSSKVMLEKSGMRIGFGGMGKGYAADQVKELMVANGIMDGVINASGDLVAWGKPPGDDYWKIGIADPRDPTKMICWIPVNDGAVATSGDYEKYLIMDGKRYAHILDPMTGMPVSGITSVTVLSGSAELSDALATAIFVLGIDNGLNLIEQLPNAECLIIDDAFNLIFSSNLNYIKNQ